MAIQSTSLPFSAHQVAASPLAFVQLESTGDDGFTFHAEVVTGQVRVGAVYCDGERIYYSNERCRTVLGFAIHHGMLPGADWQTKLLPYHNAVADLKVLVDAAISVMAKTLEVLAEDHLLVVHSGRTVSLVPRNEVSDGPSLGQLDGVLYEAANPGAAVINNPSGTAMAATLIARSDFEAGFFEGMRSDAPGALALKALYRRIVTSAYAAGAVHASWACNSPLNKILRQVRETVPASL
jgi:hypothetical protein